VNILENLHEHLSMIFFFKNARDSFLQGKEFHNLYHKITVDTEEDVENIYEWKAALAEADMRNEANEAMKWMKKTHKFIKMHEDDISEEACSIWLRTYHKIMKAMKNIRDGTMEKDNFDQIHTFCNMLRKILKIRIDYTDFNMV